MIYLLDTSILIAYLRVISSIKDFVDKKYAPLALPNEAIISVVTVGEIKAIAIRNGWGKKRLEKLEQILNQIIIADINSEEIINRYAEIDAFSQGRLMGRVSNFTARNMGKNDIWIAATTSVLDATLLTTDNDFNHLHDEFLSVAKIDLNESI